MKRFILSFTVLCWVNTAVAATYETHTIVILDDSGVAQDHALDGASADATDRPTLRKARMALLHQLERQLGRADLITIISVAVPQVIWQGKASDLLDRRNHVLARFVGSPFNGCANFSTVLETVNRQVVMNPVPVADVMLLSSMIDTGGSSRDPSTCKEPTLDDLVPPEETLAQFVQLHEATKAKFTFMWVHDEADEILTDYFIAAKVPFALYGERQTMVELSQ